MPPKPLPVGQQIRDAREAQVPILSQAELARRAGIARQATIADVEAGKNVSLAVLQQLADALKVELRILPGAPAPTPDRPGRTAK